MAFVNYNNKEITIKVVYYGPALSGKTTCLKYIYSRKGFENKGKLITLDTDGDRTLFFDFLPIEIGKLGDYSIKVQLYTVPGQVSYDTTRKLVLQGADGIVFVADSQVVMREKNIESFRNLKKNLDLNSLSLSELPLIIQYNKRDLREILPVDDLNRDLNQDNRIYFPTIATTGENIYQSLKEIMRMVIIYLKNKLSIFQKDKTVMFSREEVTVESSKKEDIGNEFEKIDFENIDEKSEKDTKDEEVYNLQIPIKEQNMKDSYDDESEDIFNLGNERILSDSSSDLEIPEVVLSDELSDERETEQIKLSQVNRGEKKIIEKREETNYIVSGIENVDIPINIKIPEDKDEIRINLNLRIILKKQ